MGPRSIRFASAMLLTAGYCASRLILARVQQRPAERDIDLVHAARNPFAHRPRDDPLDLRVNAHAGAAARELRDLHQQLATA